MNWKILHKGLVKDDQVLKILLENRGFKTKKQIDEFLNPVKPDQLTVSDFGLKTAEIKKAIARIKKAIEKKEKIVVYGDYDADGVCGAAILWEALFKVKALALPFIPSRSQGYGLSEDRLVEFAGQGVKLIITVDNGIVAAAEIKSAKKLGIDVIITDHHLPDLRRWPKKALAVVHTTKTAGCAVAWFLSQQILKAFKIKNLSFGLDLVTIGLITDMVPLLGVSRSLVKYGVEVLRKTKRLGLLSLFDFAGLNKQAIGVYEIGYLIGPCLNASGRIEDPMESLRLVCTLDESRAINLAQRIDQSNRERQELTEKLTLHARETWLKAEKGEQLIFIAHESYQEGIVGLIAGRLTEEFYLPAIIVCQGQEFSRGSARSIEEFNIVQAIRKCSDLLVSHGGHPKAAGLSIASQNLESFKNKILKIAKQSLAKKDLKPTLKVDMEIDPDLISFELLEKIKKMEPFGQGNPQPVFTSSGLKINEAQLLGSNSQHLKFKVDLPNKQSLEAIGFRMGNFYSKLSTDKPIKIAYNLSVNEWNGQTKLQFKLKDIKPNNGKSSS